MAFAKQKEMSLWMKKMRVLLRMIRTVSHSQLCMQHSIVCQVFLHWPSVYCLLILSVLDQDLETDCWK